MLEDFKESYKYNKFSMGSQFDPDHPYDELNKGFYQRRIKFVKLRQAFLDYVKDLEYTDFKEVT